MFKRPEPGRPGSDSSEDRGPSVYDNDAKIPDDGVRTEAQYQKFNSPVYPSFKRGFPRRYVDTTPDEILYDPTRILGRGIQAQMIPTGEAMLRQPRVESEAMTQIENPYCRPSIAPFECPPPFSQLPIIKKQIHIEPSRDAEIIRYSFCADAPASEDGVIPGTVELGSFDTFVNLRTIFKWTKMLVYDALCPSMVGVTFKVDGSGIKWMSQSQGSTVTSGGIIYGTVQSQNSQDLQCLPDQIGNTLIEITDRHHVSIVASNLAKVDRKVEVCLLGWIESILMWDQMVKH
jgi:hypothetical protein